MKIELSGDKVDQLFNHIMQLAIKGGASYAEEVVRSLVAVAKVIPDEEVVPEAVDIQE